MAEATTATTSDALRGLYAGLDLDALVDWLVVRTWLFWGMFWLMIAPTVGALLAGMFNYPEYLGTHLALTFGRLRPVHVNGAIMGAFSEPVHWGMLLPGAAPVRGAGSRRCANAAAQFLERPHLVP